MMSLYDSKSLPRNRKHIQQEWKQEWEREQWLNEWQWKRKW